MSVRAIKNYALKSACIHYQSDLAVYTTRNIRAEVNSNEVGSAPSLYEGRAREHRKCCKRLLQPQHQHASGSCVGATPVKALNQFTFLSHVNSHVPRTLFRGITSYMCLVPKCHVLNAPCPRCYTSHALCSQVSEDHCWLNCDPGGGREGTIEVTTDSAAKRALPVDAAAWQGWLYSGGHAPLCSHQVLNLPMTG